MDAEGRAIQRVQDSQNPWILPGAIIGAGLILAVATFILHSHGIITPLQGSPAAMRPVSATTDHIIGNPSAEVTIVEYADIDSPYAKQFQPVMEQLMTAYAAGGKVAWVYRQFPLIDQNPNSEQLAEASECVASLGDANAFWLFIDAANAAAPDVNTLDPSDYDTVVSSLGVPTDKFDACLSAHTYEKRVQADFGNAIASGASGSPYSILLVKGQKPVPIDGAIPYDTMKQIVDLSITKAEAGAPAKAK